jgi:thermitase
MRNCNRRLFGGWVLALALCVGVVSSPGWAQAPPYVRGRLLVKFRKGVDANKARRVLATFQAQDDGELPGTGVKVLSLPPNASEKALERAFRNRAEVEFAEVDLLVPPDEVTPDDPLYLNLSQWHLSRIAAPDAWSTTTGSSGIIIAILDTGVDGSHPDLARNMVSGWNVYDNNANTADVYGHGTKVAGTAAALGNNGTGVASVAWNCLIMPVRIAAADGYASYSAIASGLTWAADHGARVANISYMVTTSSTVTSAAKYFYNHGGLVSSSAGNYGTFDSSADNPYILTVGGTDENDALYGWSNTGNNIDLVAPGCAGNTTTNGGGYSSACGTSFSAPIVAGVAALVLSVNSSLTPAQVTDILRQSADNLGQAGWDPTYGYGRVNAARAVESAWSVAKTEPLSVSITAPSNGATVSGQVSVQATATDSATVTSVRLYVDGVLSGTGSGASYSFKWDTTKAANGSHILEAQASDAAGNSSAVSVSVNVSNAAADTTAPVIVLTSPANGASASGNMSVTCTAADNIRVVKVALYVDGVLTSTSTRVPFAMNWNGRKASPGPHVLFERAYDAAGNVGTSAPVAVYR